MQKHGQRLIVCKKYWTDCREFSTLREDESQDTVERQEMQYAYNASSIKHKRTTTTHILVAV